MKIEQDSLNLSIFMSENNIKYKLKIKAIVLSHIAHFNSAKIFISQMVIIERFN
jgi:hypothetical protein